VDSVHYTALAAGNLRAATCVDCHGAHDVQPAESHQASALTCGNCHVSVFQEYERSVHGAALFNGDENVPTCVDCHGVHGIQHPTTALFRNRSPELCAGCHADPQLMAQYDITTNVFESYLTDFHGQTVALFEQQDPNVPTNKAVCIDCHGLHDIGRTDENTSRVVRENLLETCQQCHPGATSSFPDSWVGHFPPTLESHPLLFLVTLFYNILIPVTLGVFILLVATDIFRRIRERLGKPAGG
jgi:predicted CXXCH cytochrome family protein